METMLRLSAYRDIIEKDSLDKRKKYFMNQAKVKGFLQKHKNEEPFKGIHDSIAKEFGGKFPCCQPLDVKYCRRFFDCLWSNKDALEIVQKEFRGNVIEYVTENNIKRILQL